MVEMTSFINEPEPRGLHEVLALQVATPAWDYLPDDEKKARGIRAHRAGIDVIGIRADAWQVTRTEARRFLKGVLLCPGSLLPTS